MITNDIDKTDKRSHPAKVFLACFFLLSALGLLAVSLIIARIDPFFRYHAPLADFPYVVDNQLSQNIGMAERFGYDAVITGSSMTMNFDTDDFTELLPAHPHPLKLTTNGALPHDIDRILDAAFRSGNEIRTVFIALDPSTWTAPSGAVKYPWPEYLYDRNPFNDVKYLWNMEVLLEYCLRPLAEHEATDLSTVYATDWEDDLYYTLDWILDHYEEPAAVAVETPKDAYLPETKRNLEQELLPHIDAHPETEFCFFFAPYSVLYWHGVLQENHLEATLSQEALLTETLLSRRNVRVFWFQGLEEVITDMDGGYMDEIHFRPAINRMMVRFFADGTCEIRSREELEVRFDALRRLLEGYDFDALLSGR